MKKVFLAVLFLLAGCGTEMVSPGGSTTHPDPSAPITPIKPAPGIKVVIEAFGAPWCGPCKAAMPELERHYKALTKEQKSKIEFRLYVITGGTATSAPTQASAEKYGKQYAPSAIAIADIGQKVFRKNGGGGAIPSAALVDSAEVLLKRYTAGATFLPAEIVKDAVKASEP